MRMTKGNVRINANHQEKTMSFKTMFKELEKEKGELHEKVKEYPQHIHTYGERERLIESKISAVKECEKMVRDAIDKLKYVGDDYDIINADPLLRELGISDEEEEEKA